MIPYSLLLLLLSMAPFAHWNEQNRRMRRQTALYCVCVCALVSWWEPVFRKRGRELSNISQCQRNRMTKINGMTERIYLKNIDRTDDRQSTLLHAICPCCDWKTQKKTQIVWIRKFRSPMPDDGTHALHLTRAHFKYISFISLWPKHRSLVQVFYSRIHTHSIRIRLFFFFHSNDKLTSDCCGQVTINSHPLSSSSSSLRRQRALIILSNSLFLFCLIFTFRKCVNWRAYCILAGRFSISKATQRLLCVGCRLSTTTKKYTWKKRTYITSSHRERTAHSVQSNLFLFGFYFSFFLFVLLVHFVRWFYMYNNHISNNTKRNDFFFLKMVRTYSLTHSHYSNPNTHTHSHWLTRAKPWTHTHRTQRAVHNYKMGIETNAAATFEWRRANEVARDLLWQTHSLTSLTKQTRSTHKYI